MPVELSLRSRLRFVISRIMLILFGIATGLAVAELMLRLFPVPNRFTLTRLLEQQWETDGELLLRLKPNLDMRIYGHPEFSYTVRTNADGLRDEPFEGPFDIAAIGDSFTFGFGVEEAECWPTRLQAIGGGVGGSSQLQADELRLILLGAAGIFLVGALLNIFLPHNNPLFVNVSLWKQSATIMFVLSVLLLLGALLV